MLGFTIMRTKNYQAEQKANEQKLENANEKIKMNQITATAVGGVAVISNVIWLIHRHHFNKYINSPEFASDVINNLAAQGFTIIPPAQPVQPQDQQDDKKKNK